MFGRLLIAALAATFAAGISPPVAAEPAKAPVQQPNQPAKVLLASSEIRAPEQQSEGQASAPVKRPRAARVTTCRCGGQTTPQ